MQLKRGSAAAAVRQQRCGSSGKWHCGTGAGQDRVDEISRGWAINVSRVAAFARVPRVSGAHASGLSPGGRSGTGASKS